MKINLKRKVSLFLTIIASLCLLLFFIYLGFKDENVTISTTDPTGKMQYALVNEDKGAVFEGKNYSLGSDFVTLINKDSKNRWETTTRNIATAGVESGQFDAQIIIPQDFSEKLLSLQSINPEKALIEYQVRDGQNEITNQMIQDNVNMILTDFNQRIIQMYFSSIVGNLFEAQQNVNQIAGTQVNYQTNLESSIYSPFKEIPGNYTNVLETASILDTDNQSFSAQQQAFVQSVKELLDRNNQGLEGGCQSTETVKESVEDYTKQANEKLKESIKQFNDQVAMQKKQLNEQWETDTADYKKQHDQLNETILSQLGDFYTNNEQESTGVYAGFLSESVLFQVTQIKRITELQAEIAELQAQTEQLTQLKSQIAATYYNDPAATPDTATTEQVKTAILQLISDLGGNTPKLNAEYQGTLETSLAQIPDKSLEQLVDELAKQQVITPDQASLYLDELAIVRKYAHDLNKPLGKEVHFTYLDPRQGHPEMITIPQQTVTLSMDPTKENTYSIQLPADSQEQVSVMLDGPKLQEIEQLVNDELHPYRYQTTIIDHSDHQFTFAAPEKIEETEESTQDSTDDLQEKELPKQVTFTVNLPIIWHLNSIEQATSYNELHYSWCRNETVQSDHHYAVYLPVDQPLIDDVPKILTHLQALDTAAQQIATLFGNPNQSLSVQSYAAMIRASENQGKTVLELAKDQSIYRRYDNITNAEKQTVITDKLYEEYKKSGDRIYKDTETQINRLQAVIGHETDQNKEEVSPTLYGTLNLMTIPEKLLQEADKLNQWFTDANRQIKDSYNAWGETAKIEATSVINEENPHPEENETKQIANQTESLVQTMQELMRSSKETAASTEKSAAEVKDIAPVIEELKTTTADVQSNATTILTNLDQSIQQSKQITKENEEYAKTFEKVLSNTKNGGADNTQVFHFLSRPIQGKGIFGQTRQISLVPYYATLTGAILLMVAGLSLLGFMKKRKVTEANLLVQPTRIWLNVPNVFLLSFVTTLLAGFYAGATSASAGTANRLLWFSYAFLTFASMQLLVTGCLRQFKKLTLYGYGSVLGLYFILTPLLGVTVKIGSFTEFLYRLSPLQNIQNGFTVLLNGGRISWISYLVIAILLVLGLFLNLIVLPEEQDRKERES